MSGLPNIVGSFTPRQSSGFAISSNVSGAFYVGNKFNNNIPDFLSGASNYIAFDASRCSKVYRNIDKVQPPAISLHPQIKF